MEIDDEEFARRLERELNGGAPSSPPPPSQYEADEALARRLAAMDGGSSSGGRVARYTIDVDRAFYHPIGLM